MPQLGESVTEGTIARWLKGEGDEIEKDEPLAEVDTDKVNAELPSPLAGKIEKLLVSRSSRQTGRKSPPPPRPRPAKTRPPLLRPRSGRSRTPRPSRPPRTAARNNAPSPRRAPATVMGVAS
jgi:pyruvate/2-oxoglutarate dehydrogenase complex dihydrolipoamide acyltransferase (E2) component